jgi:hypothetical protein
MCVLSHIQRGCLCNLFVTSPLNPSFDKTLLCVTGNMCSQCIKVNASKISVSSSESLKNVI